MDAALALGFAALGRTAPNPAVGCILVKDGRVVGAGATQAGGRPHAERVALDQAGPSARGATAYVTLEPCAHHGQTPPCADALIAAGVDTVFVAVTDDDTRVAGEGIAWLQKAGITVVTGVRESRARAHHAGFFSRLKTGRPLALHDRRPALFDAEVSSHAGESLDEALLRLGQAGANRVRLTGPETPR
ncbi:bifunctional diaminohydroxyphosphoribosylaminopyrimidine deaminase/5-amino-6-(5-phosphoribosylamino)uracil reductase RibD [Marinicauda pacifica]|uniref:diaminohydroxyphosphoribosylaminopyrimidine deaminase n=2 Tax=Marinicauda pacifica TaxID=1133559 RepID=A0A4S2H9M0_9PROT|nr:bifunctional diaminohydroxyphosphoribosylaminopyrimidine deaminase/5-amino-6-(5-phosphoribosylamino)uracil reductase RibD [Marinicauda pacifica]